jgi:hypothetical protein
MATISEVMQSIAKMPEGEEFKTYLRLIRDAVLIGPAAELTYYKIGQRDLALELLDSMEEPKDERRSTE